MLPTVKNDPKSSQQAKHVMIILASRYHLDRVTYCSEFFDIMPNNPDNQTTTSKDTSLKGRASSFVFAFPQKGAHFFLLGLS